MVKTVYNLTPGFGSDLGKHPAPPPLPHYDPKEEAPKWDWSRLYYILPMHERHPDTPRAGGNPDSDDKPDWRGIIKDNIVPMPKVEPYDFGKRQYTKYFWFDTPDYADPFKKLWYSFKWFALTGATVASIIAALENLPLNYATNRRLFSRYWLPCVMGGMAYSVSVITVANLRGNKDDLKNYIAAGLVAGCVTGRACYLTHLRHTLFWVGAGTFAKYNAETNGVMLLRMPPSNRGIGLSGHHAEGGISTGNLQFIKSTHGDPGRDVRTFAL